MRPFLLIATFVLLPARLAYAEGPDPNCAVPEGFAPLKSHPALYFARKCVVDKETGKGVWYNKWFNASATKVEFNFVLSEKSTTRTRYRLTLKACAGEKKWDASYSAGENCAAEIYTIVDHVVFDGK